MRKTFFICTLFICFLFVACSSEKQKVSYDSFISDMTNDGVIQKAEKEWWIGKYEFNNLAEQKKEIIIKNEGVSQSLCKPSN